MTWPITVAPCSFLKSITLTRSLGMISLIISFKFWRNKIKKKKRIQIQKEWSKCMYIYNIVIARFSTCFRLVELFFYSNLFLFWSLYTWCNVLLFLLFLSCLFLVFQKEVSKSSPRNKLFFYSGLRSWKQRCLPFLEYFKKSYIYNVTITLFPSALMSHVYFLYQV